MKLGDSEFKVFQAFITPRYPLSTRSIPGVVKDTGLDRDDVEEVIIHNIKFFDRVGHDQWKLDMAAVVQDRLIEDNPTIASHIDILLSGQGSLVVEKLDIPQGCPSEMVAALIFVRTMGALGLSVPEPAFQPRIDIDTPDLGQCLN